MRRKTTNDIFCTIQGGRPYTYRIRAVEYRRKKIKIEKIKKGVKCCNDKSHPANLSHMSLSYLHVTRV